MLIGAFSSDWSALDGIEALERYFSAREEAPVALPHTDLIKWFSVRLNEVVENGLEGRLAALPVFPTGGTQAPLPGLALPSDFKDPLQLANLVDLTDIRECLALALLHRSG